MRLLKVILTCLLMIAWSSGFACAATNPLVERLLESRRVVSTIYFDDNSYLIPDKYRKGLETLVAALQKEVAQGRFIRAEGFAADENRDIYSFKLSLQRAKSVVEFLGREKVLPEIYLTGYGDLKANGSDSDQEWRVEIASYDNVIDMSLLGTRSDSQSLPIDNSPIDSQSLRLFKQGHMEALSKFDEPLVIDALAIEQALMEKLGNAPPPSGAVSQVDWSGRPDRDAGHQAGH